MLIRRNRRLFVTGGAGFLGRHLVNRAASQRWELIAPTSRSLDLRDREAVLRTIAEWRPAAIIHTAVRDHDRTTIVDATRHVAEAAARSGVRLVHVSTDLVFAGRPAPYAEPDRPAPRNAYGTAKAEAEQIVAQVCRAAAIVRTSLILGSVELSRHERAVEAAIAGVAPITFFTDEIRCPVIAESLAEALTALAAMPSITGLLHLAGPDPISRADLAHLIARRHGWDAARIDVGEMGEARQQRPDRVVLDSSLAASHGLRVDGPRQRW